MTDDDCWHELAVAKGELELLKVSLSRMAGDRDRWRKRCLELAVPITKLGPREVWMQGEECPLCGERRAR